MLEQPKLSLVVQHLSQPPALLPPTAPTLPFWPPCSPNLHLPGSGSPAALHQP